jgi:anti-sigma factor RsiW
MDCKDVRKLLDAYLDTELDLRTSLEIESHVSACPGCEQRLHNRQVMRDTLQADALYYPAPARLRAAVSTETAPARLIKRARRNPWLGLVAMFVVGVLISVAILPKLTAPNSFDTLAQEVVASHIRSLMVNHLSDVISTDQHTVKPWFDGKIDFSPVVIDLAAQGFPLIGGRLDYLADRSVTALVYQRAKHIINLFEWPALGSADSAFQTETIQGYHVMHWDKAGMTYWAASDVELDLLQSFAQFLQSQTPGSP